MGGSQWHRPWGGRQPVLAVIAGHKGELTVFMHRLYQREHVDHSLTG